MSLHLSYHLPELGALFDLENDLLLEDLQLVTLTIQHLNQFDQGTTVVGLWLNGRIVLS